MSMTSNLIVPLGQQRSGIRELLATRQADAIGSFLNRENATHRGMVAPPDKLEKPSQESH